MPTRFVAARSPPKILFLDIDGVLNSADWYARQRNGLGDLAHFDPTLVRRVDEIARRTGAAVVISSAWRLSHPLDELRALLRRAGLVRAPIIGETPEIEGGILDGLVRAVEILHWLEDHPVEARAQGGATVRSFAILDDLGDFGPLAPWHVRTSFDVGVTRADVEHTVALLTNGAPGTLGIRGPECP
jgi:hypothetical protein